jgi:hypothetical protein
MSFNLSQKNNKRISFQEIRTLIFLGILFTLVLGLLVAGNYYLSGLLPPGGQFSLLRTASQSFLFDRVEPYSANIPSSVQEQVYGRFAAPGEKPYILDVPFYLLPIFFPLALISNELISRTIWLIVLELGLLSFLIMSLRLATTRAPIFLSITLVIMCFISYYAVCSLVDGTEVILLGAAFTGILLALRAEMDELAGALLVLSSFWWQVGAPFLLFVIILVYSAQRWRVLVAAGMLAFLLGIISFLLYPGWILPFLRASWNNLQTGFGYSTTSIFTAIWPEFGRFFARGFAIILLIVLGIEWRASRGAKYEQVLWTACLTIAATPLLGFRSELVNLVVLLFPFIIILLFIRERWQSIGTGIAVLLLLAVIGTSWIVYLLNVLPYDINREFLFMFLPVITILGLYWIRWWMIRLPRTWIDQVSSRRG